MNESTSSPKVYEISYLFVPSLPQEKVNSEVAVLSAILQKSSATVIADEAPSLISLAYKMDKSTGGGLHQRFDRGYFGWFKFSCSPSAIEEIRKSFELNPNVLRALAVSTLREKTYLGKRAKTDVKSDNKTEDRQAQPVGDKANAVPKPASSVDTQLSDAEIAAVDQKLDEIVKGA